jgi:hypothetical protein
LAPGHARMNWRLRGTHPACHRCGAGVAPRTVPLAGSRRTLKEQLDPKHSALPGLQAIVADRGYTGLGSLAASHGLNLDIMVPPAPPMLPPTKPGGEWRKSLVPSHRCARSTRSRTRSPGSGCGGDCRALMTALGAQTWPEGACLAYLCGRLRVEPT